MIARNTAGAAVGTFSCKNISSPEPLLSQPERTPHAVRHSGQGVATPHGKAPCPPLRLLIALPRRRTRARSDISSNAAAA